MATPAAVIPPPALARPTAQAPFPAPTRPTSSGIGWVRWLLIGGGALATVVVIGLVITGLMVTGALGPVTSSDKTFSVKVPKGWVQGNAATVSGVKPDLALARVKKTNGVEAHFIVADAGQFAPLSQIEAAWESFIRSGKFPIAGNLGSPRRTTVAGAPALTVDYQGSKYGGQLLFVDYGSKTYVIEMSSDPSEFAELRDSDFAEILSSWEWR